MGGGQRTYTRLNRSLGLAVYRPAALALRSSPTESSGESSTTFSAGTINAVAPELGVSDPVIGGMAEVALTDNPHPIPYSFPSPLNPPIRQQHIMGLRVLA